ncbi:MAG TPA: PAS domain-containing protein [Opitutaceae bacterium]
MQSGKELAPGAGQDYFQQLADGAPVMIWMSGPDLGCFYFNEAWLAFRGRTLEQESGNGWAAGVHPEDLERCVNHYVACFERRIAFAMSDRLQDSSGDFRWILDRGAPHFASDGSFLGFFGGCAELGNQDALGRHAELGTCLAAMRTFAQGTAPESARSPDKNMPLEFTVRRLVAAHEGDSVRIRQAAQELTRLANDMAEFAAIGQGVCLPRGGKSAA